MFNCFVLYSYRVKTNVKTSKLHQANLLIIRKIAKNKVLAM